MKTRTKRALINKEILNKRPRLLGGTRRGFALQTSVGEETRPTAVRARKALFDALAHRASLHTDFAAEEGSAWLLDAFAGSGALGLEALSRNPKESPKDSQGGSEGGKEGYGVFFESNAATAQVLRANIEQSGLKGRVLCSNALAPMPARTPDERGRITRGGITLAFFDPPYAMEEAVDAPAAFAAQGWFAEGALVVFQRAATREQALSSLGLSLGEGFAPLGGLSSSSACFFFFRYATSY